MGKSILIVTLALALVACASGPRSCPAPGDYVHARAAEPYTVPAGLERPSPAGRLPVPTGRSAVPAGLQGNRYEAADGSMRCLDQPPPMRPTLTG